MNIITEPSLRPTNINKIGVKRIKYKRVKLNSDKSSFGSIQDEYQ